MLFIVNNALEKEVEKRNPIEKKLTKKKVKLCDAAIKAPSEQQQFINGALTV